MPAPAGAPRHTSPSLNPRPDGADAVPGRVLFDATKLSRHAIPKFRKACVLAWFANQWSR